MEYYKVWYYNIYDQEGEMHSLITTDLNAYIHNNPYETGIEVFQIKPATAEDYKQYGIDLFKPTK